MLAAPPALLAQVRAGTLDVELAGLLWLLADRGVPVHVVDPDGAAAEALAAALAGAGSGGGVTAGRGRALEDVLREPVPLRPATGAVVVLDGRRVTAAHFHRPPLRDAAGHIRPQGPAVLATWDERLGAWEHFAWGITPELADAAGIRPGDFEIEHGRRRAELEALLAVPH